MIREALTLEALRAMPAKEAAAYLVTRRAAGLTEAEEELLTRWLAEDETHRRSLTDAERAWSAFDGAEGDEILEAMRSHALGQARRPAWRAIGPLSAAAAILLVLAAGLMLIRFQSAWMGAQPSGPAQARPIQYVSAPGARRDVQLPDGSQVVLDADTLLVADMRAEARKLELRRGRAYFAVAPDPERPFVLTAGGRRIAALGTRFDVNLAAGALTVTLVEGRLAITPPDDVGRPVLLAAGQQYVARGAGVAVKHLGIEAEHVSAWREGFIRFDDLPLAEAIAVMNRYSDEQIVSSSRAVGSLTISGQFRAGDAQRFAETVAEVHGLRTVRQGNRIELLPAA